MPARKRLVAWTAIALLAMAAILLYQHFDLARWLNLEVLKQARGALQSWYHESAATSVVLYFSLYALATAISIPGAIILTLAAGAIFGFWTGLVLVSFASSVGALFAFLVARYLLQDIVQKRFGSHLARMNQSVVQDGAFYLLTLRLVPVFPFWLINLLMGLTPMKAGRYYIVSQIGMLPATAVYVNAGTQIAAIESTSEILSASILGSLALLGLFPWLAKMLLDGLRRRKIYSGWKRPARFDRNLIIIGAGAGGLVSAYIGAAVKAQITLVEAHQMGGDCLNTGCVPSKSLIRCARAFKDLSRAKSFGIDNATGSANFAEIMRRIHQVIADIEPHDSVERYQKLGVEVLKGHARLCSPWEVEITDASGVTRRMTARQIVLATGAAPIVPAIPGISDAGVLTSETVWNLKALPKRLVILGGGPIGCELAQSFARLGSQVTQIERGGALLPREDRDASELVTQALRDDGVKVLTDHEVVRVEMIQQQKRLIVRQGVQEQAIDFDQILCAVGRQARVMGYGLQEIGVALTQSGAIATNNLQQTNFPNIYAVGDVAGPYQLTHAAAHQAWYATVNALFGRIKRFSNENKAIPWTTFTDPEVARVGLSETEARDQGVVHEITRYKLDDLDRAIADGSAHGFVKVLTVPGKDKILGVTIVSEHASELLTEYVLAIRHGLGLNKILATVHTYPTWSEANKYAAGEWKRTHVPQWLMPWLERFHAWERK